MPFWVSIALRGSDRMNYRLTALEVDHRPHNASSPSSSSNGDSEKPLSLDDASAAPTEEPTATSGVGGSGVVVEPSAVDYGFAMFFIAFGAVALVFGVASNVYVQINGIYNIPA